MTEATKTMYLALPISEEKIENILVTAFEGGVGYWATIVDYKIPHGVEKPKCAPYAIIPLMQGGAVVIEDREGGGERYTIDRVSIVAGLETMARDYPKHFGDFLAENDDATTGDVFLQCVALGKVIYG